jgi:hypothetical protein
MNDPILKRLFDEIVETCKEECETIFKVFPNPSDVIQVFVQRIFAQSVSFANVKCYL